jgi:hypothetical protein
VRDHPGPFQSSSVSIPSSSPKMHFGTQPRKGTSTLAEVHRQAGFPGRPFGLEVRLRGSRKRNERIVTALRDGATRGSVPLGGRVRGACCVRCGKAYGEVAPPRKPRVQTKRIPVALPKVELPPATPPTINGKAALIRARLVTTRGHRPSLGWPLWPIDHDARRSVGSL